MSGVLPLSNGLGTKHRVDSDGDIKSLPDANGMCASPPAVACAARTSFPSHPFSCAATLCLAALPLSLPVLVVEDGLVKQGQCWLARRTHRTWLEAAIGRTSLPVPQVPNGHWDSSDT